MFGKLYKRIRPNGFRTTMVDLDWGHGYIDGTEVRPLNSEMMGLIWIILYRKRQTRSNSTEEY